MTRVIKKFGGTSLANEEKIDLAVEKVIEDLKKGNEVIVVVSAMGRAGDPYATDTLIGLLKDVSQKIDSQKQDLMMSCGETISASLFAHYLDREGYSAVPMTGYSAGIYTDGNFGDARVIDLDSARINQQITRGKPVVLTGFQGRTVDGELTTLGRGGSDTTALVVGQELNADAVEIYTDVPGVAVADPDIVEDPRYFSKISGKTLLQLALNGTEVIHPRAAKIAVESKIPVKIKTARDGKRGTLVTDTESSSECPVGIAIKHGYTLLKGKSKEISRDPALESPEKEVFHVDGRKSVALVGAEEVLPSNGYKKINDVSLVTAIITEPDRTVEIRRKILEVLPEESYTEKLYMDYGLKFVVRDEDQDGLVKNIYRLLYGAKVSTG